MSSNVVKCANCKIVINEVLAFVCKKTDEMDEESLTRICLSAVSLSGITVAKKLLHDLIPVKTRMKIRKGEGKSQRDIDDIICLLKVVDPELIPVYAARESRKLPPVLFENLDVI